MRSPIWLRVISDVPPAIESARLPRPSMAAGAPGPSVKAASGPDSAARMAASSRFCSANRSFVTLPSGPGPAPDTFRWALRRLSSFIECCTHR